MSDDHCLAGLRAARLKAKIDPAALADAIGNDVRTYYRYEQGTRRIPFDKVCALADLLGVSTDELRRDTSDGTVVAAALSDWVAPE